MTKGKPHHNPNKLQNQYGEWCSYYEEYQSGKSACECGYGDVEVCKGNRYNCTKVKYKKLVIYRVEE